jgi:glycerophosphoryl diester phosphodiesterase
MNSKAIVVVCGAALLCSDCEASADTSIPTFADGGLLRTGVPLTREQLMSFEGMFDVTEGQSLLGSAAALRTSPGTISVLTEKNAGFSILGAACLPDKRVVVEGYWQYPALVQAGLVRLFVDPPDLASALCDGMSPAPTKDFVLSGSFGHGDEFPRNPLSLSWSHTLKPWRGTFFTVAHHGACELTDHCGASPNSLESIRLAERTGSNAAEIDVRVTSDGQAILFHDPVLSSSGVRGLFCNGAIADLSFADIRGSCQLKYGEVIPTLEEALQMMIDETELEGVYLDVKVPEAVLPTARLAAQLQAELQQRNTNDDPSDDRHFAMIVGIPSEEVLGGWHSAKSKLQAEGAELPPCLVEYDPNVVLSEHCEAWGPTWTAGPQPADVQRLRDAGVLTIFWTMNQSDFIDAFLTQSKPNGIITARTALVFSRYQAIGTPPYEASSQGTP